MTATLRFRPVVFGPPDRPTTAHFLLESSDGQVCFRDPEIAWPLDVALDAASVQDLPEPYRREEAEATLLPIQTASGQTGNEAFDRMLAALEAVARKGVPSARTRAPSTARRRSA